MVRNKIKTRRSLENFTFVIPFLIFYVVFLLYPVIQAVLMSFFDWDLLGSKREFIGTRNYSQMLWGSNITWDLSHQVILRAALLLIGILVLVSSIKKRTLRSGELLLSMSLILLSVLLGIHPGEGGSWNDPRFWNAFRNTVVFTVVSTPIISGLGLLFALLLQSEKKTTPLYRAALFIPYVLPVSVATLIWGYFLNPSRGLVAKLSEAFGEEPIAWLSDPRFAMGAIIVTTVWWTVGFNMILFGAGLQDIDPSLYEAARIDGASRIQQFRYITLPSLKSTTLLIVVTQVIASFQIFGQVNIMTSGGPGGTTDVLVRYIYQTGFRDTQLGYAAAMSLFLFVVMVLVSLIQFLISREKNEVK